jgi:hypothetical protein
MHVRRPGGVSRIQCQNNVCVLGELLPPEVRHEAWDAEDMREMGVDQAILTEKL